MRLAALLSLLPALWGAALAGKFDTGLFENFDVTKAIFESEIELVNKLQGGCC